jgi:hypothetical protein
MVEIAKIKSWLEATGWKPYKLGLMACANPYAVERIMSGTATVNTLRDVLRYIDAHPIQKGKGK